MFKLNPDLFQFEYKPLEPYSLILPGEKIEVGDIKCAAGEENVNQWSPIKDNEVRFPVPHLGIVYARVEPPIVSISCQGWRAL